MKNQTIKNIIVFILIIFFQLFIKLNLVSASVWEVTSVDTMKYSRDISREKDIIQRIPTYVKNAASLGSKYISVATPYDEEFYPVLKTWVSEIRKYNKLVWFRGNWSSWEGWFSYPKFSDYREHHEKTYNFLINHKELFKDGDIFTPAPEPENGGLGDPRGDSNKTKLFQEFLIESYNTCERATGVINIKLICGYFSTNGDVARESFNKDTVDKIGGVLVIDHFVKSPQTLIDDIKFYNNLYKVPVMLGEIGAPIPDIHGVMDEHAQASYIKDVFNKLLTLGSIVKGVNYWTIFEGSTLIFNPDLSERKAADVLRSFYNPTKLVGIVTDSYGNRMENVTVSMINGNIQSKTDVNGKYEIMVPGGSQVVSFDAGDNVESKEISVSVINKEIEVKNITLEYKSINFIDRILKIISGSLIKVTSVFRQN